MTNNPTFKIDAHFLQAILNYLATKPYHEVFELIAAIQNLSPYDENTVPETTRAVQTPQTGD